LWSVPPVQTWTEQKKEVRQSRLRLDNNNNNKKKKKKKEFGQFPLFLSIPIERVEPLTLNENSIERESKHGGSVGKEIQ
jgi:hypothetical protein